MVTREEVYEELRKVHDPEIPVNIVDLGLVYDVRVEDHECTVTMSLTSQGCPAARQIPEDARRRIERLAGIERARVDVVWEPAWTPHRISAEGRRLLGMDEAEPATE